MISFTDRAWRDALVRLALVAMVVGVGFHSTWTGMFRVWMASETFGHSVAVAPISAWMVWRDRQKWLALPPSSSWLGLPFVVLGALAWLLAELASVNVVAQYGAVAILVGLILSSLGLAVARQMSFALGFLFLMVPAGEWLNGPLMEGTASATIAAVRLTGIPVFRDGMFFSLPSGQWSVVEACSGLRYVLVAVMLGILFARLNFTRVSRQVAFVIVALVLAVVANWIRAWLIVMIGHFSHMRYGTGDDHVWYGWVFFGVVMFGLFWMGARWREGPNSDSNSTEGVSRRNLWARAQRPQRAKGRLLGGFALGLGLAIAAPALAHRLLHVDPLDMPRLAATRDLQIAESRALQIPMVMNGARWMIQGQDPADPSIDIAMGYFAQQLDGHEMIAHGNGLPSKDGLWTRTGSALSTLTIDGQRLPVRVLSYRSADPQTPPRTVVQFYVVSGAPLAADSTAKIQTALALLRGRGDHSMLVMVSVPVSMNSSSSSASASMNESLDPALPVVRRLLDFARQATAPH